MPLDFNIPICQHSTHKGQAVPATFRLEHTEYGVLYYCYQHPSTLNKYVDSLGWTIDYIGKYLQPAQEQHVDR